MVRKLVNRFEWQINFHEFSRLIKHGLPFAVAALFSAWLLQGPIILYRHWGGLTENLGQLALALQAFMILAGIVGEFGNAALPALSRSIHRQDGKADQYVAEVLRLGWFMGGCLLIGGLAVGNELVVGLFGKGYTEATRLLPWTLLLVTLHFWMYSFQGMVGIHGHFRMVIMANLSGATAFTLFFLLFTAPLGSAGTVFAFGAGLATVVLLQLLVLQRYHQISFLSMFLKPAIAVIMGAAICLVLLDQNHWLALLAGLFSMLLTALSIGVFSFRELVPINRLRQL
jgi:O-antigen/teichoic acid export membrane protein